MKKCFFILKVEEYQPRSGGKPVSYEHCDQHDQDATNGCPKCEESESRNDGPSERVWDSKTMLFENELETIEFCLATLAEQRDDRHRIAEMHWAAYCGADGQEREQVAHDYRERAQKELKVAESCTEAHMNANLINFKLLHEKKLELDGVIDELVDVRAVLGETQDRLARATRQGDLADALRETLAKRVAELDRELSSIKTVTGWHSLAEAYKRRAFITVEEQEAEIKGLRSQLEDAKRVAETHDVDEYQRDAGLTATNIPNRQTEILVRCLKLASESGELADIVGSAIEGSSACDLASMRARVEGELGDVLWYVARIATLFDLKLSDVTAKNLAKVKARATGGYWQPTYCEFCGHQVFDPRLAECPFCGAK